MAGSDMFGRVRSPEQAAAWMQIGGSMAISAAEGELVVTAVAIVAQLTEEGVQLLDQWIHSKGDEAKQVALARIAANVSVDAYERIRDLVK